MTQPWFIKYKPTKFTDMSFIDDSGFKMLSWLKLAQKGSILALCGGVGRGKTCLVYAAAKALKYRVVEYNTIEGTELKNISGAQSVDGLRPLILVDEADIPHSGIPRKFFNLALPVIFIFTSFVPREIETLKMSALSCELIVDIIRKILKSEGYWLEDRLVLRLCELCDYDVRSVINYCQAFVKTPAAKDLNLIEKVTCQSITSTCRSVLSRRMPLNELEKIYTEKILKLCVSSALENSKDPNLLRSIESISEIAELPEKFRFLSIDGVNRLRSEFIYKREDTPICTNGHGHENPMHYLPLYNRNLQDRQSIKHLQQIFTMYKVKELSEIDQEIMEYVEWSEIKSRAFKYKHVLGSSSAVKRDISLKELMGI